MKSSTFLSIGLGILTFLWRLVLTAAVVAALCCAGVYILLDTVLCGPSETARDQLTLTLLESDITREIPGKFLDEALLARIQAGASAEVGTSDPGLITPGTAGTIRCETVRGETYTAQVQLTDSLSDAVLPAPDGGLKFMGYTADGILVLSDTAEALQGLTNVQSCGPVLMLDGRANETLLAGSSGYAPYTALGQRADGTLILVTADGWSREHPGATYRDLINIMREYGAVNACILGVNEG